MTDLAAIRARWGKVKPSAANWHPLHGVILHDGRLADDQTWGRAPLDVADLLAEVERLTALVTPEALEYLEAVVALDRFDTAEGVVSGVVEWEVAYAKKKELERTMLASVPR